MPNGLTLQFHHDLTRTLAGTLGTENKIEIRGDPGTYLDQMIVLGFIADKFLLFRGLP